MDDEVIKKKGERFLARYGSTFRQLVADLTGMVDARDGDSLFLSRHLFRILDADITDILKDDPLSEAREALKDMIKTVNF